MTGPETEFNRLFEELREGSEDAAQAVWELLYGELRSLAASKLASLPPGQTLQSTALVNEAWMRLAGGSDSWDSRAHFFGAAARAMRNILVDRARSRDSLRHGGAQRRVPLTGIDVATFGEEDGLVELDEALARLEVSDPRAAEVVNLRYFAGLSIDETAQVVGISHATVEREWTWARSWLRNQLGTLLGGSEE